MRDKEIQADYAFGPFYLEMGRRRLLRQGQSVALQPKDFETLLILVQNRERVVAKDELIERLWPDTIVEEANLSQHIYMLRKALGEGAQDHSYIVTVSGGGYRFVAPVAECWGKEEELIRTHLVIDETKERERTKDAIIQQEIIQVTTEQNTSATSLFSRTSTYM